MPAKHNSNNLNDKRIINAVQDDTTKIGKYLINGAHKNRFGRKVDDNRGQNVTHESNTYNKTALYVSLGVIGFIIVVILSSYLFYRCYRSYRVKRLCGSSTIGGSGQTAELSDFSKTEAADLKVKAKPSKKSRWKKRSRIVNRLMTKSPPSSYVSGK